MDHDIKFKIVAPDGTEEIKEFISYAEMRRYLLYKNDKVFRDDVRTEKLDFPLKKIEED